MSLKQQIDEDIKAAMLSGDKTLVTTLKGVKSSIQYAEVANGTRDSGMPDDEVVSLLMKEAKKRQESAELYLKGGNNEKSQAELQEKVVIEKYLPAQMDDEELGAIIKEIVESISADSLQDMGRVIGAVKQRVGSSADGARIAQLVKERLSK